MSLKTNSGGFSQARCNFSERVGSEIVVCGKLYDTGDPLKRLFICESHYDDLMDDLMAEYGKDPDAQIRLADTKEEVA